MINVCAIYEGYTPTPKNETPVPAPRAPKQNKEDTVRIETGQCIATVWRTNTPCRNSAKSVYDNLFCGQHKQLHANLKSIQSKIKKNSLIILCRVMDISVSKKNKTALITELMTYGGTIGNIIESRMNVCNLREICKIESIEGYSNINKAGLISKILAHLTPLAFWGR